MIGTFTQYIRWTGRDSLNVLSEYSNKKRGHSIKRIISLCLTPDPVSERLTTNLAHFRI